MEYWEKKINTSPKVVDYAAIGDSDSSAIRADDESYVEDKSSGTGFYIFLGGFFLLLACIFLGLENNAVLIFSLACIPAVLSVLYGALAPKKTFHLR